MDKKLISSKFRGLLVDDVHLANVIMAGIPFDGNASIGKGAKYAPDKFRELSYFLPPYTMEGDSMENVRICDMGDLIDDDYDALFYNCTNFIKSSKFKLVIGGDHSISIPLQKEFFKKCRELNKIPVVVHIDAHCDISDVYNNCKYSHACVNARGLNNGLLSENLYMIGIREFEKDGYEMVKSGRTGIHLYTSINVLRYGIAQFVKDINLKNDDNHLIYVSFDIDSLDCAYAPGTGTPEPCGLTPLIVKDILCSLAKLQAVDVLDVVEVSPPLDVNNVTTWCALKLVYDFLYTKINN